MLAIQGVIPPRQHREFTACRSPVVQGLRHGTLAQRPVVEIGIAQQQLSPPLLRRCRQSTSNQRSKFAWAAKASFQQTCLKIRLLWWGE
jgi:hypothetical protein